MSAAPILEADRVPRLLDQLLDEQQQLTAVERFAQHHTAAEDARWYRDLIPADSAARDSSMRSASTSTCAPAARRASPRATT
jgi:hypothetical protein